jgi:hypothetical protein
VSQWGEVFLGVIAASTLTIAIILIAILVASFRLVRRLEQVVERAERELSPALGHLNRIAADAARAASLASAQVERVDALFGEVAATVGETVGTVRSLLGGPLRKGGPVSAGLSAFWAVWSAIRDARAGGRRGKSEDEDALFI